MDLELPEPSVELVLIRALVDVHLRMMSPKDQARFIREMNDEMELRSSLGRLASIRPKPEDKELARARREAADWWDFAMQGYGRKVG